MEKGMTGRCGGIEVKFRNQIHGVSFQQTRIRSVSYPKDEDKCNCIYSDRDFVGGSIVDQIPG